MDNKIKSICMFSNLFPPVVSGSSTQCNSLAQELVKQGKEVTVITSRVQTTSKKFERIDGVNIYRLPCIKLPKMEISLNFPWLNFTFLPRNLKLITKIIEKHNPDVLHLHNHMFDLAFSAVLMRRKFKIPLVVTIHTVIKHAQSYYNFFLIPIDKHLLKPLIINNTDLVISPDYNILTYVKESFGISNSMVVPYGISLMKPPSGEKIEYLRQKFHLKDKRIILSLGHVHKLRDRRDLVKAMPIVLKKIPDAVLLIVGSISTNIPFKAAKSLGIEDFVIFTGPMPHSEVGALLELADLEAHWLNQDSPDKTSLGIATMESMGFGKVAVTVANEDTYGSKILKNEKNIILIDPENPETLALKLIELLKSDKLRLKIGKNGQNTVEKYFTWDIILKKTMVAYENAICRYRINQDNN